MKVVLRNSKLVFAKNTLNEIGRYALTGISSTATYTGHLPNGTYYMKVVTNSTTPLTLSAHYGSSTGLIKEFAVSEFGTNVQVTLAEEGSWSAYWRGSGDYEVIISEVAEYTKIGEVTFSSGYANSKLSCSTNISQDLAAQIAQHSNIAIKVTDSNGLMPQLRGINVFNYDNNAYTYYVKEVVWDVICKTLEPPFQGNIYVQGNQALPYTPANGDTTIKIEFFYKA